MNEIPHDLEDRVRRLIIPVLTQQEPATELRSCYDCEHVTRVAGYPDYFKHWCSSPRLQSIVYPEGNDSEPCSVLRNLRVACGFEGTWYQRRDPKRVMNVGWLEGHAPAFFKNGGQQVSSLQCEQPCAPSEQETGS